MVAIREAKQVSTVVFEKGLSIWPDLIWEVPESRATTQECKVYRYIRYIVPHSNPLYNLFKEFASYTEPFENYLKRLYRG